MKRKCFLEQVQDQEQRQQHLLGDQHLAEEQPIHSLQTKECPKQGQVLPAHRKKEDRQQHDKSRKTNCACSWKKYALTVADINQKTKLSALRQRNLYHLCCTFILIFLLFYTIYLLTKNRHSLKRLTKLPGHEIHRTNQQLQQLKEVHATTRSVN